MDAIRIEITCQACEQVQDLTVDMDPLAAEEFARVLDGTSDFFVIPREKMPKDSPMRSGCCRSLFDARVIV